MKKNLPKSNKVTLETLDFKIERLFGLTNLKIENYIESLATSTAKGFSSVEEKIRNLDKKVETLDQNIQATRREVLSISDKFVIYTKFDELASRVTKLEKSKK